MRRALATNKGSKAMAIDFDYLPASDDLDAAPVKRSRAAAGKRSETTPADYRGSFATAPDALRYMLAGSATVTFKSVKTGTHYTYRLKAGDNGFVFIGVLTGADNETNYSYLGYLRRGLYIHGRRVPKRSDVPRGAPSAVAFDWVYRQLVKGTMPKQLEIWHDGSCGRCGRKLTHPDSVARGIGPECASKMECV